jgi:hypothetical protein
MPAPEKLPKRHVDIAHLSMTTIRRYDEIARARGVPRNTVIAEALTEYIVKCDAAKKRTP